jgi:hypothetical protein
MFATAHTKKTRGIWWPQNSINFLTIEGGKQSHKCDWWNQGKVLLLQVCQANGLKGDWEPTDCSKHVAPLIPDNDIPPPPSPQQTQRILRHDDVWALLKSGQLLALNPSLM